MSHYSVLVLHKEDQDINTLLAPYDENLKVKPYLELTNDEAINARKQAEDKYYGEYSFNNSNKEIIDNEVSN